MPCVLMPLPVRVGRGHGVRVRDVRRRAQGAAGAPARCEGCLRSRRERSPARPHCSGATPRPRSRGSRSRTSRRSSSAWRATRRPAASTSCSTRSAEGSTSTWASTRTCPRWCSIARCVSSRPRRARCSSLEGDVLRRVATRGPEVPGTPRRGAPRGGRHRPGRPRGAFGAHTACGRRGSRGRYGDGAAAGGRRGRRRAAAVRDRETSGRSAPRMPSCSTCSRSSASRALANARRYTRGERARTGARCSSTSSRRRCSADAELDRVVYLVTSVLDKVLEFEVGGLLLFGREEPARVVLRADVSEPALAAAARPRSRGPSFPTRFLERCVDRAEPGTHRGERWARGASGTSSPSTSRRSRPNAGYLFVASRDSAAFTADDTRLAARAGGARLRGAREGAHVPAAARRTSTSSSRRSRRWRTRRSARRAGTRAASWTTRSPSARRWACRSTSSRRCGSPGCCTTSASSACPSEIILKPARLTDEEMAEVKRHAEIGANIVDQMEFLDAVGPDRPASPRALGRRRVPEGTRGRGDTARGAHPRRRGLVRRDDVRAHLQQGAAARHRQDRARARGGRAVRSRRRPRVHRHPRPRRRFGRRGSARRHDASACGAAPPRAEPRRRTRRRGRIEHPCGRSRATAAVEWSRSREQDPVHRARRASSRPSTRRSPSSCCSSAATSRGDPCSSGRPRP